MRFPLALTAILVTSVVSFGLLSLPCAVADEFADPVYPHGFPAVVARAETISPPQLSHFTISGLPAIEQVKNNVALTGFADVSTTRRDGKKPVRQEIYYFDSPASFPGIAFGQQEPFVTDSQVQLMEGMSLCLFGEHKDWVSVSCQAETVALPAQMKLKFELWLPWEIYQQNAIEQQKLELAQNRISYDRLVEKYHPSSGVKISSDHLSFKGDNEALYKILGLPPTVPQDQHAASQSSGAKLEKSTQHRIYQQSPSPDMPSPKSGESKEGCLESPQGPELPPPSIDQKTSQFSTGPDHRYIRIATITLPTIRFRPSQADLDSGDPLLWNVRAESRSPGLARLLDTTRQHLLISRSGTVEVGRRRLGGLR